jgi:hypothetical protein
MLRFFLQASQSVALTALLKEHGVLKIERDDTATCEKVITTLLRIADGGSVERGGNQQSPVSASC